MNGLQTIINGPLSQSTAAQRSSVADGRMTFCTQADRYTGALSQTKILNSFVTKFSSAVHFAFDPDRVKRVTSKR
jgi:hypothetical protein